MDLTTELLVEPRQADLRRAAQSRRLIEIVETCRRRLFGVLPLTEPCQIGCA